MAFFICLTRIPQCVIRKLTGVNIHLPLISQYLPALSLSVFLFLNKEVHIYFFFSITESRLGKVLLCVFKDSRVGRHRFGSDFFNDGMIVVNFRMGISSRGAQSMTDNLDASSW